MGGRRPTLPILFLGFLLLSAPISIGAGEPTEQIRVVVEKALVVLKNPELTGDEKKTERREQLRRIIFPRFDFDEMARRSLGSQWRRRTPGERKEFVGVFRDLMERTYSRYIESYNDEKFVYLKEIVDGNYAEVRTLIVTQKGEEFSINYKTRLEDGEWKIYDVVAENISLVNNYRSQFRRIISKSSYEDLVRKMKDKRSELLANESE